MNNEDHFKKEVAERLANGTTKIRVSDTSDYQWESGYADWLMNNYETEDYENGFYALITKPLTNQ